MDSLSRHFSQTESSGAPLTSLSSISGSAIACHSKYYHSDYFSIIDFLTAVFMMPLHVVGYVLMKWPFPQWMCAFQESLPFRIHPCGYRLVQGQALSNYLALIIFWLDLHQAYIYFCCGYTSVVCLVAITLNRLVGIVYPLHYKVARQEHLSREHECHSSASSAPAAPLWRSSSAGSWRRSFFFPF